MMRICRAVGKVLGGTKLIYRKPVSVERDKKGQLDVSESDFVEFIARMDRFMCLGG
jgi:hypothetical protein